MSGGILRPRPERRKEQREQLAPAALEPRPLVVAIDGPAGSGKSSVSREGARRLGFELLDTGAAYRALAWRAMDAGVDLDGDGVPGAVIPLLPGFDREYAIALDPAKRWTRVGDVDISAAIRSLDVSRRVSAVARIPEVREALTARFRRDLARTRAPGIIAEGRDLTTVVAPDADVRILLTADEAVRIARRRGESEGEASQVAASVAERDRKDARVASFLEAADGVTLLDSTELNFEGTVTALIALIDRARELRGDPRKDPA